MPRCRPTTAARWPAGRWRVEELHAALDAAWESVGFLTREHEEARRAAAHEAIARFWAEQQRDPARPTAVEREFTVAFGRDRLRGRYDRVDRDEAGRVVITDYKSSDVRDLATANRRARESLQLSIYALAHEAEHGALPDELALHFLESGIVGRTAPSERRLEKAQEQLATAAEGIRAGRFDADARAPCAAATVRSARSAPTRRDERPASARRSHSSSWPASWRSWSLVAVAGRACPAETARSPAPMPRATGSWS